MTKFRIFALLLVLLTIAPVYAQKIAFVEVTEVWNKSKEKENSEAELKPWAEKRNQEVKKKEDELRKLMAKMEKEAKMATDEAKAMMLEEYQKKNQEYQELAIRTQREMADKQASIEAKFVEKVKKIAHTVAVKQGYDIVLPAEQALYYSDKFDITKAVIAEINK